MSKEIVFIIVIASVGIIFSPMYFQRQKLWRMADEDLKRLDYDEWKKQLKRNAYIKLCSRLIWGIIILSGFIFNFKKVIASGFSWATIIVLLLGISFIFWGVLAFRSELVKVSKIQ